MNQADLEKVVQALTDISLLVNEKVPLRPEIVKEQVMETGPDKVISMLQSFASASNDEDFKSYECQEFKTFVETLQEKTISMTCWDLFLAGKIEANVDPKTNQWMFWTKK